MDAKDKYLNSQWQILPDDDAVIEEQKKAYKVEAHFTSGLVTDVRDDVQHTGISREINGIENQAGNSSEFKHYGFKRTTSLTLQKPDGTSENLDLECPNESEILTNIAPHEAITIAYVSEHFKNRTNGDHVTMLHRHDAGETRKEIPNRKPQLFIPNLFGWSIGFVGILFPVLALLALFFAGAGDPLGESLRFSYSQLFVILEEHLPSLCTFSGCVSDEILSFDSSWLTITTVALIGGLSGIVSLIRNFFRVRSENKAHTRLRSRMLSEISSRRKQYLEHREQRSEPEPDKTCVSANDTPEKKEEQPETGTDDYDLPTTARDSGLISVGQGAAPNYSFRVRSQNLQYFRKINRVDRMERKVLSSSTSKKSVTSSGGKRDKGHHYRQATADIPTTSETIYGVNYEGESVAVQVPEKLEKGILEEGDQLELVDLELIKGGQSTGPYAVQVKNTTRNWESRINPISEYVFETYPPKGTGAGITLTLFVVCLVCGGGLAYQAFDPTMRVEPALWVIFGLPIGLGFGGALFGAFIEASTNRQAYNDSVAKAKEIDNKINEIAASSHV